MKPKLQQIVAATDGSPESEEAFAAMMPLVRADRPEVSVLHVFKDAAAPAAPPPAVVRQAEALRAQGIDAHAVIRVGNPPDEILRFAGDRDADLIVLSTHGREGLRRIVDGSVAEEVIRRAGVPVLVTRAGAARSSWGRIAVALDGSTRAQEILQDVIPLARSLGASVDLVRASLPPITMTGWGDVPGVVIHEDPMPYLRQVQSIVSEEGLDVRISAPVGRASSAILQHVADTGASLICLTTHGRTGFERVLLGSIAEEILRHATCPVLLRRTSRNDGILWGDSAAPEILESGKN